MAADRPRPLSVAILALGGQGGGVLTRWLVDLAEANGHVAQSTYVAGVAQRTGATVYCVEMFPAALVDEAGQPPVFAPYSIPGDVDLAVAGELAETGRAILNGFVTPDRTTLIASSHRVYSIEETTALGNGIIDQSPVIRTASELSRRFVSFDMQRLAAETGSVISSVLFGAIAASGALPFGRAAFEETIRKSGTAIEANLRGFAAGFEQALAGDGANAGRQSDGQADEKASPAIAEGPKGESLLERVRNDLPAAVQSIAGHGALRVLDYQDEPYAQEYLDRVSAIYGIDRADRDFALTAEVARQLALQMCYEDMVRVAELKTRGDRFDRIREQVAAADGQPLHIVEYFHPRFEEFCDTLPKWLGSRLASSQRARRMLRPLFSKGRNITTSSVSGFALLRLLASLKRWRRGSYRFGLQRRFIDDWLSDIRLAATSDYDHAVAVAEVVALVRGYSDTYERGLERYREILATAAALPADERGEAVRRLFRAAQADEAGEVFAAERDRLAKNAI